MQYQPCLLYLHVCFWLIRSFIDPEYTSSIFVRGPLLLIYFTVLSLFDVNAGIDFKRVGLKSGNGNGKSTNLCSEIESGFRKPNSTLHKKFRRVTHNPLFNRV